MAINFLIKKPLLVQLVCCSVNGQTHSRVACPSVSGDIIRQIDMENLPILIGIHLMALASPGPDFYVILRASTLGSVRAGLYCSFGIVLGVATHLLLVYWGLALVIHQSPALYLAVVFMGGVWLLRIAWLALRTTPSDYDLSVKQTTSVQQKTPASFLMLGYLTNLLNPKAFIYFISIISQIVRPDQNSHLYWLLATILMSITLLWFFLLSACFRMPGVKRFIKKYGYIVERFFGVFIVFFVMLILYDQWVHHYSNFLKS